MPSASPSQKTKAVPSEAGPRRRSNRARPSQARASAPNAARAGGEQRVGLGKARFCREHDAGGKQGGGQQRPASVEQGEACPVGQQDRRQRAEKRGDPVEPDLRARLRHTERLAGRDGGGLGPVDPDRLLVAGLGLEADIDEVARLQHLLGRLGKARLVPVHRLERGKARQETGETDQQEQEAGAEMARGPEGQHPIAKAQRAVERPATLRL